ncbi:MAG: histidine phosphatase family protein [Bacillota bacterium]|nr:histidine phosphatase family protein [Bacillota bacterium]
MTRVYIIRHAEARGNVDRIFHGITDGKITENGYAQLKCLSARMSKINLDVIYHSDLSRTTETALAVRNGRDIPMIADPRLREINGGEWEGKKWTVFPKKYPEETEYWLNDFSKFIAPRGESVRELYDRAVSAVKDIVSKNKGKTIAIVTHGTLIRTLTAFLKGLPLEKVDEVAWRDNTAVSIAAFDDTLQPTLLLEGDNSHLGELSTLEKQNWWKNNSFE